MKKLIFICAIFAIALISIAANQTSDYISNSPGTLTWSAAAGWEATGTFRNWEFIKFELPEKDFTKVEAEIGVHIGSVSHEEKSLAKHMRKSDYLSAKKHPTATIKIEGANYNEESKEYTTTSTVSIKGKTQEIPLVFTVEGETVKGKGTILRKDFNVGDDSGVRNEVYVSFEFDIPKK